jgi:hypothetical protein
MLLQTFEVAIGSVVAYGVDAHGWNQSVATTFSLHDMAYIVMSNLPQLANTLSKHRSNFTNIFNTIPSAGFAVQLFFIWRIFLFSKNYSGFGNKIKVTMFVICNLLLLASFSVDRFQLQF